MLYFTCHTEPVRLTEHLRGTRKCEPKKTKERERERERERELSEGFWNNKGSVWAAFATPI